MTYIWIWADGQLSFRPQVGDIHHINLLQDLHLPNAPVNFIGGTYEEVNGDPRYDTMNVLWHDGTTPTSEEIKFMINSQLGDSIEDQAQQVVAGTIEDSEPPQNFGFLKDPHEELYPCVWKDNKMIPKAKKAIKDHMNNYLKEQEYGDPDKWMYWTVYGSGASYNWDEEGDFDLQLWVDYSKYKESHPYSELTADELLADIRRLVQIVNFPSFADLGLATEECEGKMLVQYYAKAGEGSEEENLSQQPYACYDLETDRWIVEPKPYGPSFYGEEFVSVMPKAKDIAVQIEALIADLDRNVASWSFWTQLGNKLNHPFYLDIANQSRDKASLDKEALHKLFLNVFRGRMDAYAEYGKGIEDERDAVEKMLEVWGTFQTLRHYVKADLPWDEQEMPLEKEAVVVSRLGAIQKFADWSDIMEKAKRLKDSGQVQLQSNQPTHVNGIVQGDHGTYNTEIWRDDPNSRAITLWNCDCPWSQYSWGRTRQFKKFEGRPCAHTLALFWTAQQSPVNDTGQAPPPPEVGPQPGLEAPMSPVNPQPQLPAPMSPVGPPQGPPDMIEQGMQATQQMLTQQPSQPQPAFSQKTQIGEGKPGSPHFPGSLSHIKEAMGLRGDLPEGIEFIVGEYEDGLTNEYGYRINAYYDNKSIGEIILIAKRDKPNFFIGGLNVEPKWQRRGVAEALFKKGEEVTGHPVHHDWEMMSDEGEAWANKMDEKYAHLKNPCWCDVYDIPHEWTGSCENGKRPTLQHEASFSNGERVRARYPMIGIDRAGAQHKIPANVAGEVLYSDEKDSYVIFPLKSGKLEPHLVRVRSATENFYPEEGSTPFIKRHA